MVDAFDECSRMLTHPLLLQLAHQFSRRTWVLVIGLSFVLACSSVLVLAVSAGVQLPEPLASWYTRVELFARDTVRLTFKPRKEVRQLSESVFMAPPGTLDENRNFVWIEGITEVTLAQAVAPDDPRKVKTPLRLLDPSWQPEFKGD